MTETGLSSLVLMAIHHDFQINTQAVIKLLTLPAADESCLPRHGSFETSWSK